MRKLDTQVISLFLILLLLTLLPAGCQSAPSLIGQSTPHPALVTTAQADQYWRDARATSQAQVMTVAANYQNVQGTAQAATSAAAAGQTRESLAIALTVDAATMQAAAMREQATAASAGATAVAAATGTRAALVAAAEATNTAATVQAAATGQAVAAARQQLELSQAQQAARREQITTVAVSVALFLIGLLLAAILLFLLWRAVPVLLNRLSLVRYGQHGNPLLLSHHRGRTVVGDPLRMLQAAMVVDEEGRVQMPTLASERLQWLLSDGVLQLLGQQAAHAPGHPPALPEVTTSTRRVGPYEHSQSREFRRHGAYPGDTPAAYLPRPGTGERTDDAQDALLCEGSFTGELSLPGSIPWALLAGWQGPGLVLGAARAQAPAGGTELITLDPARTPHLFVAGMSGSGKTRRLLRPLVAQALAAGYYVLLVNESGSDFAPFYDRPNATVVRGDVGDYLELLDASLAEMSRRERLLRRARVSEWGRLPERLLAGNPPLLLAIDELLALALLLSPKEQRALWGRLAAFASRAHKVGMASIGVATDQTYRALGQGGLNYRSQCGRVSFRMIQAAGSRAVLDEGGAETLPEGQFMALLAEPGVIRGATANPDDEQLRRYLERHAPPALPQPAWLPNGAPPPVINFGEIGDWRLEIGDREDADGSLSAATSSKRSATGAQPAATGREAATTNGQPSQPVATGADAAQPTTSNRQPVVQPPFDAGRAPTAAERAYIRRLYYNQGLSKNETCRRAYGYKDGKTYRLVSIALADDGRPTGDGHRTGDLAEAG